MMNINYYELENYLKENRVFMSPDELRFIKDFMNTKVGMFTYENLFSKDLTSEIMEMALLFRNHLCLWKNTGTGDITLCIYITKSLFNYYWKPTRVQLIALNGVLLADDVSYNDIVLVRDNTMDIIPFITIQSYIDKIAKIENTMFMTIDTLRLPVVFKCSTKKQVPQINQMFKDIKNFKPFVVTDEEYQGEFEKYDVPVPVSLTEMYDIKNKYRSELMASMGIYAVEAKRERLLTAEIQSQNEVVDFIYTNMLNERKRFIKEANAKFGTNCKLVETYVLNKEQEQDLTAEGVKKETEAEMKVENKYEDKEGEDNEGSNN